jgi:hypothetical protein
MYVVGCLFRIYTDLRTEIITLNNLAMGNRKIGYYWVKYPVMNWQTAMWNGKEWFITGHNKPLKKIDNVGDFIGVGGRNAPASDSNCNIHIVSHQRELLVNFMLHLADKRPLEDTFTPAEIDEFLKINQ